MGLLILIVTGSAIGWLVTVITDAKGSKSTTNKVLAGIGGALAAGVPLNGAWIWTGLTPLALLAGAVGSFIAIATYRYLRQAHSG